MTKIVFRLELYRSGTLGDCHTVVVTEPQAKMLQKLTHVDKNELSKLIDNVIAKYLSSKPKAKAK